MTLVGEDAGKRYYAGEGPDPYVFVAEKVGLVPYILA